MYGTDGPGDKLFRIIPALVHHRTSAYPTYMESMVSGRVEEFDRAPHHSSVNSEYQMDGYFRHEVSFRLYSCLRLQNQERADHSRYPPFLGNMNGETTKFSDIPETLYQRDNFYHDLSNHRDNIFHDDSYLTYLVSFNSFFCNILFSPAGNKSMCHSRWKCYFLLTLQINI